MVWSSEVRRSSEANEMVSSEREVRAAIEYLARAALSSCGDA